jgi:hypothetical protein
MRYIILLSSLVSFFIESNAQDSKFSDALQVWSDLVKTSGIRYDFEPELRFVDSENNPAYYSNGVIHIEEKLLTLLNDSLGGRNSDGLAYVLSHELAHHNRQHVWNHFAKTAVRNTDARLSENRLSISIENESVADLDAGMNSHIAGYSSLDVSSRILDLIYSSYDLPDSIPGYPTLGDRKAIQEKRLEQFKDLSVFYDVALMSLQIGDVDYAIKALKNVLRSGYKSYEVYELLAYSYFMRAKSALPYENLKMWAFPIKLSDNRILSGSTRAFNDFQWSVLIDDLNESKRILSLAKSRTTGLANTALEKSINTLLECAVAFDEKKSDWKFIFNEAENSGLIYDAFAHCAYEHFNNDNRFKTSKKLLSKMDVDDLSEIISFNLSLLNDDSEPYIAPNKLPSVIKEAVKEVITTSSPFGASSEATEVYSLDGSERLTFTRSKNWTSINPGSSRNHLIEIDLDAIGIGEEFDWMWNYDKCLALDAKMTLLFTANTRSIHLINEKSVLVFDADEHLKSLFTYIN